MPAIDGDDLATVNVKELDDCPFGLVTRMLYLTRDTAEVHQHLKRIGSDTDDLRAAQDRRAAAGEGDRHGQTRHEPAPEYGDGLVPSDREWRLGEMLLICGPLARALKAKRFDSCPSGLMTCREYAPASANVISASKAVRCYVADLRAR